ncbi:MAG: hypothetical protein HZB38_06675 [Planctomycetes bacterium]|nr:hypothetical protein [Planctomycetota bacterium]
MIRTPTVNPGWYGRLTRQLGDDVQIDDDFASAQMTLTHDHNGNLTGGTGVPPVNCGVRPQPASAANLHEAVAGAGRE